MNDGTNELVAEVEARELELKLQLIVCTVTFTAKEIKRLTTTNSNKSKRYAVCVIGSTTTTIQSQDRPHHKAAAIHPTRLKSGTAFGIFHGWALEYNASLNGCNKCTIMSHKSPIVCVEDTSQFCHRKKDTFRFTYSDLTTPTDNAVMNFCREKFIAENFHNRKVYI